MSLKFGKIRSRIQQTRSDVFIDRKAGMISQAMEYSLRAMALLAQNTAEPIAVQHIAERCQVPAPYLSKLMQGLVKSGLVKSRRGVNGGFTLSRPPAEITLSDIVQAVDPIRRIERCPLGIKGHVALCPLHRKIDQAIATIDDAFRSTSLADLFQESGGVVPLCETREQLFQFAARGT